jgi:nucleoside-diphosphate-sugar epimerase
MNRARVVVLGVTGFVGRAIAAELVRVGYDVDGVVRRGASEVSGVRSIVLLEPGDPKALRPLLEGAEAVINAAGRAHVLAETATDPLAEFRRVNVGLAESIAKAAAGARVPLYVEIGSVAAVGEQSAAPLTRATAARPVSPYGISKLEAEQAALACAQSLRVIVLRPPMIYGPGMKGNPLRLFDLLERGSVLPLGAIHNRRSMLYVENLAAAVAAVVARPVGPSGSYFVADSQPVSTTHLARTAVRALGVAARLIPVPVAVLRAGGRVGDVIQRFRNFPLTSAIVDRLTSDLVLDTNDLSRDFDFVPPISFDEGIARTARWYREYRVGGSAA